MDSGQRQTDIVLIAVNNNIRTVLKRTSF